MILLSRFIGLLFVIFTLVHCKDVSTYDVEEKNVVVDVFGNFVSLVTGVFSIIVNLTKPYVSSYLASQDLLNPATFLYQAATNFFWLEDAAYMRTAELIEAAGYPAETHDVTTEDGYIIEIHRIPHNGLDIKKSRVPLLLLPHPWSTCSDGFVLNFRNQSSGFVFSDAGYDVWLGNVRGNEYGLRHKTLNSSQIDFWRYSLDDLGVYDIPAMIDYIIKVTGHKKIMLVSMELIVFSTFVTLEAKPEYNDKILAHAVLSPFWRGHERKLLMISSRILAELTMPVMEWLRDVRGEMWPVGLMHWWNKYSFKATPGLVPNYGIPIFNGGLPVKSYNQTRCPVYGNHVFTSFSVQSFIHLSQMAVYKAPTWYDFGTKENLRRYNQSIPPIHQIDKMKVPTLLAVTVRDFVMGTPETQLIVDQYPAAEVYNIPEQDWTHAHYCFALNGREAVYDKVIDYFGKHQDQI